MAKKLSLPCSILVESYHRRAVDHVRKFIEIGGEKYATYHAHGFAKYLPVSSEELIAEAKKVAEPPAAAMPHKPARD